jgi:hypothetical protein
MKKSVLIIAVVLLSLAFISGRTSAQAPSASNDVNAHSFASYTTCGLRLRGWQVQAPVCRFSPQGSANRSNAYRV